MLMGSRADTIPNRGLSPAISVPHPGGEVGSQLVVVGWHAVRGSSFYRFPPGAGQQGIERQLHLLTRVAHVVHLGEALDALSAGQKLPSRAVALTFDDGYCDNLEIAVPLLERFGVPATFFLVPGFLSRRVPAWWEVLAWAVVNRTRDVCSWEGETLLSDSVPDDAVLAPLAERLKRRDRHSRQEALLELTNRLAPAGSPDDLFLDWEGARSLVQRRFDIGSHTMFHSILSSEPAEEQRRDLADSRHQLEEELGAPVRILAYPNGLPGDYDETTISMARSAGYAYALTTERGINRRTTPRYEVKRFMVDPSAGLTAIKGVVKAVFSGR